MSEKKLKKIFILCLAILMILIMISSCDIKEFINNRNDNEPSKQIANIMVEDVQKFDKLNYNNLTIEEMDYISDIYSGNAKFTSKGVEIYYESIFSGKLRKIITSNWPEGEIGNFIPNLDYGTLNRIEYADNFIEIYIDNAKKKNVNDYLKKLKEYGFTKNKTKDEGKVMLQYEIYNESGNKVLIRFMKNQNTLFIRAEK